MKSSVRHVYGIPQPGPLLYRHTVAQSWGHEMASSVGPSQMPLPHTGLVAGVLVVGTLVFVTPGVDVSVLEASAGPLELVVVGTP